MTRTAVPAPAPVQRKAIALAFVAVLGEPLRVLDRLRLRLLSAGDEGRQPVDVAVDRRSGGLMLTRRISLLLAWLIGLLIARRMGLLLARLIGLLIACLMSLLL